MVSAFISSGGLARLILQTLGVEATGPPIASTRQRGSTAAKDERAGSDESCPSRPSRRPPVLVQHDQRGRPNSPAPRTKSEPKGYAGSFRVRIARSSNSTILSFGRPTKAFTSMRSSR